MGTNVLSNANNFHCPIWLPCKTSIPKVNFTAKFIQFTDRGIECTTVVPSYPPREGKGLSQVEIAGIAVGSAIFVLLVIISVTYVSKFLSL